MSTTLLKDLSIYNHLYCMIPWVILSVFCTILYFCVKYWNHLPADLLDGSNKVSHKEFTNMWSACIWYARSLYSVYDWFLTKQQPCRKLEMLNNKSNNCITVCGFIWTELGTLSMIMPELQTSMFRILNNDQETK